jgi:hypothetical protein
MEQILTGTAGGVPRTCGGTARADVVSQSAAVVNCFSFSNLIAHFVLLFRERKRSKK